MHAPQGSAGQLGARHPGFIRPQLPLRQDSDEMLEFGGGVIAFGNGMGDLRFHFLPEPLAEAVNGDFHRAFAHAESGGRIRL